MNESSLNLPLSSLSFFASGGSSPSFRRSFRKISRLATGRRSSRKWKVPRDTFADTRNGENNVRLQGKYERNEDGKNEGNGDGFQAQEMGTMNERTQDHVVTLNERETRRETKSEYSIAESREVRPNIIPPLIMKTTGV